MTTVDERVEAPEGAQRGRVRRRWVVPAVLVVVLGGALAVGLWPRLAQSWRLAATQEANGRALPRVAVVAVKPGEATRVLQLPGSVEAITEAVIHARADGYLKRRLVDIGDRVRAGDLLADIESPELAEQIQQGEAAAERTRAAVRQAQASLEQARANSQLADVTAGRWATLVEKGVLSRQDGDEKQSARRARAADLSAAEANIAVADSALHGAEADHRRLLQLQVFRQVRAPFDGVVVARYADVGDLVTAGSSVSVAPLFRVAAVDRLRVQVFVPQGDAGGVRVGQSCDIELRDVPGVRLKGEVTRTAGALDSALRTLQVEIVVDNRDGRVLPGMWASVRIASTRQNPPPLIPSAAFRTGEEGPRVAVVDEEGVVRLQPVRLGRDTGSLVEVLEGLAPGQRVVTTITDDVVEGARVEVMPPKAPVGGGGPAR